MSVVGGDAVALAADHPLWSTNERIWVASLAGTSLAIMSAYRASESCSLWARSRTSLRPTSGFFMIRSSSSSRLKETTVEGVRGPHVETVQALAS